MNSDFRMGIAHLAPVILSLLFGILCAVLIAESQMTFYAVTPFPDNVSGSFGNAVYFVVLVGVGAFLLYLLLKRKSFKLISLITGFAITIATLMLSLVYSYALFSIFAVPYTDALAITVAIVLTALADYGIFRKNRLSDLVVLLLGGALGTFLGISIPTPSAILVLSFLAVYDMFAVYRGPVGKIARGGLEQLRGLSFSFRDVQMGLGDLTFYSMLTSRVFFDAGPLFCLTSLAGVIIGVYFAFRMLEKKGMFPGLPFPTALGLIPLIVSFVLK